MIELYRLARKDVAVSIDMAPFMDMDELEQEIRSQYSPLIVLGVRGYDGNYRTTTFESGKFSHSRQSGVIFDIYEKDNYISEDAKELRERVAEYRKMILGAMNEIKELQSREFSIRTSIPTFAVDLKNNMHN